MQHGLLSVAVQSLRTGIPGGYLTEWIKPDNGELIDALYQPFEAVIRLAG
ncbi:hypothetical protein GCM10022278_12910 [Allohahella marinimesophila]|uniref:Uncharacterized protein n=1 Tax=Allohahella marinimesophila TaxID=1054972 RepID=A0ABP7NX73_9GAMM